MNTLPLAVICALFWITSGSVSKSKLHNFMDEEELRFYFGSETELPDYEIVDLPENLSSGREGIFDEETSGEEGKFVSFEVFEKQVNLNLFPKLLLSPFAKVVRKKAEETLTLVNEKPKPCHYIHVDRETYSSAAVSNCVPKEIHGLIFLNDETLEIVPLSSRLKFAFNLRESTYQLKNGVTITKVPHLIKRSSFFNGTFEDDFLSSSFQNKKLEAVKKKSRALFEPTVEIGLFFDEAFYKFFAPFFEYDDEKLDNFILSYINGVQALYHHPTLDRKVHFVIVYIEIMEEQPYELPHAHGERNALIDNFCDYQKSMNPADDRHPNHYDMALYISGLDFFAWDASGSKNGATMGLATVGGVRITFLGSTRLLV